MPRRRAARRIPGWAIGLALALVVWALAWIRPAFLEGIEDQLFDLRLKWFGSRVPAGNIAIVAIDEESMTKLDRWPGSRSPVATRADLLAGRGGLASRAMAAAPRAQEMPWPLPDMGEAAAGVGHVNRLPDADGERTRQLSAPAGPAGG